MSSGLYGGVLANQILGYVWFWLAKNCLTVLDLWEEALSHKIAKYPWQSAHKLSKNRVNPFCLKPSCSLTSK